MPEVDSQLVASLKLAKTTPMRFAFVTKSLNEGRLLLAKKPPVPVKEITEAKKELGGGHVLLGRCRWDKDNEQYVFELGKEPSATLANTIRNIIHNETGLHVKTFCCVATDLAAEEAGTHPETAPVEPGVGVTPSHVSPATGKEDVLKRVTSLAKGYTAAVAKNGPDVPRMHELFNLVKSLVSSQDFARAGKVLDELEPLIARAAVAPPPQADPHAALVHRLNALAGPIKAALAQKGPTAEQVQKLFAGVSALLSKKAYAKADEQLGRLEALLAQLGKAPGSGLGEWTSARARVLANIRDVVDAIRTIEHPDTIRAVVTFESIAKNITAEPKTPQSIAELQRWLEQDELVAAAEKTPDVLGKLSIREPLLKALATLPK